MILEKTLSLQQYGPIEYSNYLRVVLAAHFTDEKAGLREIRLKVAKLGQELKHLHAQSPRITNNRQSVILTSG